MTSHCVWKLEKYFSLQYRDRVVRTGGGGENWGPFSPGGNVRELRREYWTSSGCGAWPEAKRAPSVERAGEKIGVRGLCISKGLQTTFC